MSGSAHKKYPKFEKSSSPTHIAFKETRYLHLIENMLKQSPDLKIVGIVRNPLACLASWVQAPKEFNPAWNLQQEWRSAPSKNLNKPEEFFGFDKWKEVAENFLRFEIMYPSQFKLIRYNQLNANPFDTATALFKFCDLNMHPQVAEFIAASQSVHDVDPYSVYRAKANDTQWHKVLPDDIVDAVLRDLSNSALQTFLEEHQ